MSFVAWFLVGWLVLAAVTLGWLWWEMRHAPRGFETEHGYGPVSETHAGHVLGTDQFGSLEFDWPARDEDVSEVRHPGLKR